MASQSTGEKIAVLGLGYVGLPLALGLARAGFDTLGYDTDGAHVAALRKGHDRAGEVSEASLLASTARFSADPDDLRESTVYILGIPTPITAAKTPDLEPLRAACRMIAPYLSPGDLVVLESTVYPGVTEEVCGPLLAEESGLRLYEDIRLGYSPERVNPGDAEHALDTLVKVVSAQDDATLDRVAAIYAPVTSAGVHRAGSIKTAEAAKVIENTQRDINIALVNEFSLIFSRLGLDTLEVLEVAGTKWNFLPFRPGLVGGHCIGVDPYYLTYRAEQAGYHPEVILAGRRINDNMGRHVVSELIKRMLERKINPSMARVLVMGFTFKENCTDIRNTRTADILTELQGYSVAVDLHDPWADADAVRQDYGFDVIEAPEPGAYDAIIVAVGHRQFVEMGPEQIRAFGRPGAVLFDIKGIFDKTDSDLRL